MVNIGSTSTGARVLAIKNDLAKVVLTAPVCTKEGEKLALSRRVDKHWRLIGWGKIRRGTQITAVSGADAAVSASSMGMGINETDSGAAPSGDGEDTFVSADAADENEEEEEEDDK